MREAGLFAKAKKESATLFRVSATVRAKRVGNFARVAWPTASGCQRASPASTATMRASASFPTRIAGSAPQGRAYGRARALSLEVTAPRTSILSASIRHLHHDEPPVPAGARVGGRHGLPEQVGADPEGRVLVAGNVHQQQVVGSAVVGGERREVAAALLVVAEGGAREVD